VDGGTGASSTYPHLDEVILREIEVSERPGKWGRYKHEHRRTLIPIFRTFPNVLEMVDMAAAWSIDRGGDGERLALTTKVGFEDRGELMRLKRVILGVSCGLVAGSRGLGLNSTLSCPPVAS
jgi:hypothetical protein